MNGGAQGHRQPIGAGHPRERSRSPRPRASAVVEESEGEEVQRWLTVVEQDWRRLQDAPIDILSTPDVLAEAMRHSEGAALGYSVSLREDAEFVMGAMQELGAGIFAHAAPSLRADRDFVIDAVQEVGAEVLNYADQSLRDDSAFVLEVADYCNPGDMLQVASEETRALLMHDADFVREAVQQLGPEVLEGAAVELRGNRQFMLDLTEHSPPHEILQFATEALRLELFSDRSFVLTAIREQGAEVLEDVSEVLRSDPEFLREAALLCSPGEVEAYALSLSTTTQNGSLEYFDKVAAAMGDEGADEEEGEDDVCAVDQNGGTSCATLPAQPTSKAPPPPSKGVPPTKGAPPTKGVPPAPPPTKGGPPTKGPPPLPSPRVLAPILSPPGQSQVGPLPSAPPVADPYWPTALPLGGLVNQPPISSAPLPENLLPPLNFDAGPGSLPLVAPLNFGSMPTMPPLLAPLLPAPAPPPPAPAPMAPQVDRAAVLAALRLLGPQALHNASADLRGDREFILAAAASPVEAFRHASEQLRAELSADPEFMLTVSKEAGASVLQHLAPALRENKTFLLQVNAGAKDILQFATEACRKELCADREFVLRAVAEVGPAVLHDVSLELRSDRSFLTQVTSSPRVTLQFASEELRNLLTADRAFMLKAVRESGPSVLQQASLKLRSEKGFIIYATSSVVEAVQYASPLLREELHNDRAVMARMVQDLGPSALRDCSEALRGDKQFLLMAAPSKADVYRYATPALQAELETDRALMLEIVHSAGINVLQEARSKLLADGAFLLEAVHSPLEAFRHAAPELRKVLRTDKDLMEKIRQQLAGDAGTFLRGDRALLLEVCRSRLEALRLAPEALRCALIADRKFMIKAAKEGGIPALTEASPALLDDRELVLAAASSVKQALQCCSERLKQELLGDRQLLIQAAKESGAAILEEAPAKLLADRSFLEAAAPLAADALRYAPPDLFKELGADRAFMVRYVRESGSKALEHASVDLRGDMGFMMEVISLCPPGEAMQYAEPSLKAMIEGDSDEDD